MSTRLVMRIIGGRLSALVDGNDIDVSVEQSVTEDDTTDTALSRCQLVI